MSATLPKPRPFDWLQTLIDKASENIFRGDRALNCLAGLLAINCIVSFALILAFIAGGDRPRQAFDSTALKAVVPFWHTTADDSWWPMLKAYQHKAEYPETDLYSVFYQDDVKFQYPPSALLPLDLLPASMTVVGGRNEFNESLKEGLRLSSLVAVLLTTLGSILVLKLSLERWSPGRAGSIGQGVGLIVLGLANGLIWYPLIVGHGWGQIQVFLNALICWSILAYLTNRQVTSGIFVGLCCLIKPHYGVLLLWAFLRRRWRFAGALISTVTGGTAVALMRYGVGDHLSYARVLFWLSERGEAIWVNQGLNGLLHRFLGNGAAIETVGQSQSVYPPYHLGVHVLSTLFMGLIIGLALFFPRRGQGQAAGTLDFATMIVAVTLATPIAWMHQYGGVLPVFALAMAMLLSIPERLVLAGPLLAIAYISMGQVVLKWSWFFENPWRGLLGSQVFFGALLLFGVLLYLRSGLT